jgi:uncharacterized membrane protein
VAKLADMTDKDVHITADQGGLYNVISVSFDNDDSAFTAMTKLKELDDQDRLGLKEGAVVVRGDGGDIVVKDHVGATHWEGAAGGGLMGLLIGILGGPLGVLIGGSYGLMMGSLVDIADIEQSESVLGDLSASVQAGHTAVVAEVVEQSPEVVDTAMAPLGGTVLRRSYYDVEAEIAAAEDAERKAKREAKKELMRARRERNSERVHAKVQELKSKRPHREKASTT